MLQSNSDICAIQMWIIYVAGTVTVESCLLCIEHQSNPSLAQPGPGIHLHLHLWQFHLLSLLLPLATDKSFLKRAKLGTQRRKNLSVQLSINRYGYIQLYIYPAFCTSFQISVYPAVLFLWCKSHSGLLIENVKTSECPLTRLFEMLPHFTIKRTCRRNLIGKIWVGQSKRISNLYVE